MKIIPAIDIQNGSCVRLVKGNFNQSTTYNKSPDKQAKFFFENGFDHIHIIDLDGTQNGKKINTDIASRIANDLGLKVQFGGGIREIHDIDNLFKFPTHIYFKSNDFCCIRVLETLTEFQMK